MLWSLLRNATQRGLSWNTSCLIQRSRFSGLCKTAVRSDVVISSHVRHVHRRLICTRCYRELDIAKGSISQHAGCLKFLSSLLPNVNRRFVGTRVGLNSISASSNMRNKTTAIYTIALAVAIVGLSYLSVPLYRLYCQVSQ